MGFCVSGVLLAGAISGILTYIGAPSPFDYWPDSDEPSPATTATLTPTPTTAPTPVPTLTPASWPLPAQGTPTSLDDLLVMLAAAKSTHSSIAQANALKTVAQYAVGMKYFGIAIEAGRETDSSLQAAKTLRDVAICAAEAGHHLEAVRAANEINSTSIHDSTMNVIVRLQGQQVRGEEIDDPACPWSVKSAEVVAP